MCVCVCICDCWPSVNVVKLLVRVAILLCELKCFATHSNKNIRTHAHTHSHTYTLLQPTRNRASWTVWELKRSGVPLSWLATLALRIRSVGWQGLPDSALWGYVCICMWIAGWAENQSRRQGRAFGHILYLPSIQFGCQPVYQHLHQHQCLPLDAQCCSQSLNICRCVCAPYAHVFNSWTPSGRCQRQLAAGGRQQFNEMAEQLTHSPCLYIKQLATLGWLRAGFNNY